LLVQWRGAVAISVGIDPALELFVQSFDRIRSPDRFPSAHREAREGEEPVTRLFQARSGRRAFQPPFSDESFVLRLDLLLRVGIDQILVIRR